MKKKNKNKKQKKFVLFHKRPPKERKAILKEFYKSDLWQERKVQLFEKYGRMCEICNSKVIVQVHHNNYKARLGHERDEDLTVLCRKCHDLFHSKSRVNDPSKHHSSGYWYKGHFMYDHETPDHHCSICSYKAKYMISRDTRGRHILFCQKCLNIFRLELVDHKGEEIKTGMPITVPSEEKPPPPPAPSVRRRRKNNT